MRELDKIYKSKILEIAKNPYHFGIEKDAVIDFLAYNPTCGDKFEFVLSKETKKIGKLYFHGFGCTLSKASASIMIKELEGKNFLEAAEIIDLFIRDIEKKNKIKDEPLALFSNHNESYRGRSDCILLAWKSLKKYLLEHQ